MIVSKYPRIKTKLPGPHATQYLEKEKIFVSPSSTKSYPPEDVAAIFVEIIQGEGGYIVPPEGFHRALYQLTRDYDILYVTDEVQSGMGRTGKMFACGHFDIVPDIITLAKGIASGLPLSATVASEELMDWASGSHASTFGGNPVSCQAALATN